LEIVFHFFPNWPVPQSSYFTLPTIAVMTGTYYHNQLFFHWDGVLWTFFAQAATMILLISASHIAGNGSCTPLFPAIAWDGVSRTPCLGWPQTAVLWISVSKVIGITDMSHGAVLTFVILYGSQHLKVILLPCEAGSPHTTLSARAQGRGPGLPFRNMFQLWAEARPTQNPSQWSWQQECSRSTSPSQLWTTPSVSGGINRVSSLEQLCSEFGAGS
jgi:hypothetical protein